MNKILTGAVAALTLGGAFCATALPAAAEEHHGDRGWHGERGWGERGEHEGWRGERGYGYDGASAALLGLGLGAALSGGGYYAPTYYAPPAYYAVPRCRVEARWNPYWRTYERVRVCY